MGPCLGALPFVARVRFLFAAAVPNGGTLIDLGLINPAPGPAVGGFPVGPGGGKWAISIYFKSLVSGPFRSVPFRRRWFWEKILKRQRAPVPCERPNRNWGSGRTPYKPSEIMQMMG